MDVEKAIQFLLEQHARLDAEFNAKLDTHKARFDEEMFRINSMLLQVANTQERTNAILATLAEKHVDLAESHKELAEAQKITERTLNKLAATVERHIANHS